MNMRLINAMPLPVFDGPGDGAPGGTPPVQPPAAPPAPAADPPAPGAPPAAPAAPPTALDPKAGDDPPAAHPADWPKDWREKMATGADGKVDTKLADRLKRYDSPISFGRAGIEAQNRILSGKVNADEPMPDEAANPEGAKKWREERGIPTDPTGYQLPEGIADRLTEEDAPILANYTAYAHKAGMTPAQVAQNVEWYTSLVETQRAEQTEADTKAARDTEDALRTLWGDEFRSQQSAAAKFAREAVPGIDWFTARLPDGRLLGNVPGVAQAFAELANLKYGDMAYEGGAGVKVAESRIAELRNIMNTDFAKWESSPELRKEYYSLVEKMPKAKPE